MSVDAAVLDRIAEPYNQAAYWKGGLNGDGYTGEGYQDFPVYGIKAAYVASLRPQSVLDVGCLLPGTPIVAKDRIADVQSMSAGDELLSHDGKWHLVLGVSSRDYSGVSVKIKPRYSLPIEVTEEHPILVRDISRRFGSWKGGLGCPRWVEARDVCVGQAVGIAIPTAESAGPSVTVTLPAGRIWRRFLDVLPVGKPFTLSEAITCFEEAGGEIKKKTADTYLGRVVGAGIVRRLNGPPTVGKPQQYLLTEKRGWFNSQIPVTAGLLRLCGYFVGDGCASAQGRGDVTFAFGSHEMSYAEDVCAILRDLFEEEVKVRKAGNVLLVTAYRRGLDLWLGENFGYGAKNKRIPEWFFSLNSDLLREFLTGLVAADGSLEAKRVTITTVSRTLAMQMQLLLGRMGVLAAIQESEPRAGGLIKGRTIHGGVRYDVRFSRFRDVGNWDKPVTQANREFSYGWIDDGVMWVPVLKTEHKEYRGKVHNLEVADSHTYQSSFIVHNCAFGFIVGRLRRQGVEAYGTDVSEYALSQAAEDVRPYVQKAWGHDLPFPDRSIDVICSFGVLEHLPAELVDRTLAEFQRVARRGVLSITLSTELGVNRAEHPSLHDYGWWRRRLPPNFEVWGDAVENWKSAAAASVAILAPTILPTGFGGRYGGIERLAAYFAKGLSAQGRQVRVFAPRGSVLSRGVELVETGPAQDDYAEPGLVPAVTSKYLVDYSYTMLDFSHSKPTRRMPRQAFLAPIWHDPMIMQPVEPKWNVVALSRWQAERFRVKYGQEARVLDPHVFDQDFFTPAGVPEERFLYIGRLHPSKGALECIRLCKSLHVGLDVLGPQTSGDPLDYVAVVKAECDGVQVRYFDQVSAETKREFFRRSLALLYPVQYPDGNGEAHSHKMAEAIGAGLPCVAYDQGAMNEVIEVGVTGYLPRSPDEFLQAMRDVHKLSREVCRKRGVARWSIPAVMDRWLPVMDSVCRGERWS